MLGMGQWQPAGQCVGSVQVPGVGTEGVCHTAHWHSDTRADCTCDTCPFTMARPCVVAGQNCGDQETVPTSGNIWLDQHLY